MKRNASLVEELGGASDATSQNCARSTQLRSARSRNNSMLSNNTGNDVDPGEASISLHSVNIEEGTPTWGPNENEHWTPNAFA